LEFFSHASSAELASLKADYANLSNDVVGRGVNCLYPPAPLIAVKDDGTETATEFQNLINSLNDGDVLYIPKPTVSYKISSQILITKAITIICSSLAYFDVSGLPATTTPFKYQGSETDIGTITSAIAVNTKTLQLQAGEVSASGIQAGDWVRLRTLETYNESRIYYKKGEIQQVESVDSVADTITLYAGTYDSYDGATNTVTVSKINWIEDVKVKGLHIKGDGTTEQWGLQFEFVKGLDVEGCKVDNTIGAGIILTHCIDFNIHGKNRIAGCNKSGVGYGINLTGCCQHGTVYGNHFRNNRHSFTTSTNNDGVVRDITVENNKCYYDTDASLDTHGNGEVYFVNNEVYGSEKGGQARGHNNKFVGNRFININQSAINVTEEGHIGLTIEDNEVFTCSVGYYDAFSIIPFNTTKRGNDVKFNRNKVYNCQNGSALTARNIDRISAEGNMFYKVGYAGMRIENCNKINIRGNTFDDALRANMKAIDIEVTDGSAAGTYDGAIIKDNIYTANFTGGVNVNINHYATKVVVDNIAV